MRVQSLLSAKSRPPEARSERENSKRGLKREEVDAEDPHGITHTATQRHRDTETGTDTDTQIKTDGHRSGRIDTQIKTDRDTQTNRHTDARLP
eukprot:3941192-Rhodomonas_salina.3